MKKALMFAGVILFGSIAMVAIDALVGISFKEDVSQLAKITHKTAHTLWGAIIMATTVNWLSR